MSRENALVAKTHAIGVLQRRSDCRMSVLIQERNMIHDMLLYGRVMIRHTAS